MTENPEGTHPKEAETDALNGRDGAVLTRGRVAPPGSAPVVFHGIPALGWDPLDRYILPGEKILSNRCFGRKNAGGESETNSSLGCFRHGHRRVIRHLEQNSKGQGSICVYENVMSPREGQRTRIGWGLPLGIGLR